MEKTSKKRLVTNDSIKDITTLDAKHQNMMQTLYNNQINIENLKNTTISIDQKLDEIQSIIKNFKLEGDIESDEYNLAWSSNLYYQELKKDILSQIDYYSSHQDEIDYYDKTGYILFKYYDLLDKQNTLTNNSISIHPVKTQIKNSRKKQRIKSMHVSY